MNTPPPDIETASCGYAGRFAGAVGEYFLATQAAAVAQLLGTTRSVDSILEVGGGHAQLAPLLSRSCLHYCVQGSVPSCAERLRETGALQNPTTSFITSSLNHLPFPDRSIDLVVAFRLFAHVEDLQAFVAEIARVARRYLIFDYASLSALNRLTPLLFSVKKRVEGNTRPYFCQRASEIEHMLRCADFIPLKVHKQFFFPMGLHRAIKQVFLSQLAEQSAQAIHLTPVFGSPVIVLAERVGAAPSQRSAV